MCRLSSAAATEVVNIHSMRNKRATNASAGIQQFKGICRTMLQENTFHCKCTFYFRFPFKIESLSNCHPPTISSVYVCPLNHDHYKIVGIWHANICSRHGFCPLANYPNDLFNPPAIIMFKYEQSIKCKYKNKIIFTTTPKNIGATLAQ